MESEPANTAIRQEYEENAATDLEAEEVGDLGEFHDIERPWDPESIRVSTKTFSVRNIIDLIDEGSLDLAPDFQRLKVWRPVQKAQLMESILLQIPLPAFYFAEDNEGLLRVVDGVQRLSTIHEFVRGRSGRGGFRLRGLEYIADVDGMYFENLPPLWQRRIHNTQLVVNVIAPSTPPTVMYDIFRRINTGGTPLNAQEIRHCLSKKRSRDFLRRLVSLREFERATGGRLKDQKRMIDRELALRFAAFWHLGPEDYGTEDLDTLDGFLLKALREIDDPKIMSDTELDSIASAFAHGLDLAKKAFGEYAFRKWPFGNEDKNPLNRALFETWTVELAKLDGEINSNERANLVQEARQAMTDDYTYLASITSSTGDPRNVHYRFLWTRNMIEKVRK